MPDTNAHDIVNDLHSATVGGGEGGAQHLMALNDLSDRARQGGMIQPSFQSDRAGNGIGRSGGIHIPEEPQPLLCMRQGRAIGRRCPENRRQHPLRAAPRQAIDMAREGGEHRRIEEAAQLQLDAEAFADRGRDLSGRDRVSAQYEEIVLAMHGLDAERVAPDRRHGMLGLGRRRRQRGAVAATPSFEDHKTVERVVGPARRAGRTLQFAAGRQRHRLRIQQDDDGRIFLRLPQHRFADRMGERFGTLALQNGAAELRRHPNAFPPVHFDRKGGNPPAADQFDIGFDRLLDIRRIDVLPANDQEILEPAGDDQRAVPDKTNVSGTQPAHAVALDEGFVRRLGVIPVSERNTGTGDPDLADFVGLRRARSIGAHDARGMIGDRLAARHEIGPLLGTCDAACGKRRRIERAADGLGGEFTCCHQQRRLSQAVAGGQCTPVEPGPLESFPESPERGLADKFRAGECEPPAAQVEPTDRFIGNAIGTECVGEIGPTADRSAVTIDGLKPAPRPLEKIAWRHQDGGEAREQRIQQSTDQSHVVIKRQPAYKDVVRCCSGCGLHGFLIGCQIAMRDANALWLRR